jgi:hypothetical protein
MAVAVGIFILIFIWLIWRISKNRLIAAQGYKIRDIIQTQFSVQSCSRCKENQMILESVSPNGKSISYLCNHCRKKTRAVAATKEAERVIIHWIKFRKLVNDNDIGIRFTTPETVMPYQQTTREPIPENVRNEVWRRDGGKCVGCGSREHLQFDHIIPVSKGGTTAVSNLQILCRACNLKKRAKI